MRTLRSLLRKNLIDRYYSGARANRYEEARSRSSKWQFEEKSLIGIINKLPKSEIEKIADIPVGTNRFSDLFESCNDIKRVYGIDLSVDMLAQAMIKPGHKYLFLRHDIISSPPAVMCDTAACFRFLNLFDFKTVESILKNISEFCRSNLILSVRLVEDQGSHGKVLKGKIHLHHSAAFYQALIEAGFQMKDKLYFSDEKGGDYYVLHAVREQDRI